MIKTSRILSIILTLIIASASWTGAKAAKEGDHAIVNGIHFLINGFGTATVTNTQYLGEGYGYYTNTVQIPSTITVEGETYTVTGIQEKAFYSCPELFITSKFSGSECNKCLHFNSFTFYVANQIIGSSFSIV
jgi:hypothetical protein